MTTNKSNTNAGEMSLTGHLKELKNRIVVSVAVLLIAFIFIFQYANIVVDYLTDIGASYGYQFVQLAPQELLMQYIRVGLIGAIVVASPVWLYEIWAFVRPGLSKSENITVFFAMMGGLFFFVVGILFALKITLPFMLYFFMNINTTNAVVVSISIESYLSFLLSTFIAFGCIFELPVITVVLTTLGLINANMMVAVRPFAIVGIFVLGAFITPPDVVSQCMVSVPMIGLYQLSIWLSKIFGIRKKKKEAEDEI